MLSLWLPERAKFNVQQQETGELADSFHTALHCLTEHSVRKSSFGTRRDMSDGKRHVYSDSQ